MPLLARAPEQALQHMAEVICWVEERSQHSSDRGCNACSSAPRMPEPASGSTHTQ